MASIKEKSEMFEGHGEDSKAPSVKKGTFMQVGTVIPLQTKAYSPNSKNGSASGDEV
jgi:hypothetical protein